MKNLLLALISIVLFILLEPISFIYVLFIKEKFTRKRLAGYWRGFAIAVDCFGNYQYKSLWNRFLRTENGYEFGDFRETISSALGKNQRDGTLSKTGEKLAKILDKIDREHCKKSIMEFSS